MAIKITEQNKIIVVRRWKYSPERKRSLPSHVYSVSKYNLPDKLPLDVVTKHCIDDEEQQTWVDFALSLKAEFELSAAKYSLWSLSEKLGAAKEALVDVDLKKELTLEQYEDLSKTVNDIKKLITKNKNALKRKITKS